MWHWQSCCPSPKLSSPSVKGEVGLETCQGLVLIRFWCVMFLRGWLHSAWWSGGHPMVQKLQCKQSLEPSSSRYLQHARYFLPPWGKKCHEPVETHTYVLVPLSLSPHTKNICSLFSYFRTSNPTQSVPGSHTVNFHILVFFFFKKNPLFWNDYKFTESCKDSTGRSSISCIPHLISPNDYILHTYSTVSKLGNWHWYNVGIVLCYLITYVYLCNHHPVKIENYFITTKISLLPLLNSHTHSSPHYP